MGNGDVSLLNIAPSSAPQNLTVTALNPHSVTLHWSPPPPHSQNGVIREYRVNVTEVETGMEFNFTTSATSITVPFLHPYYTYECVISAYTVATGPYTEVTVMTPEDGMLNDFNIFLNSCHHNSPWHSCKLETAVQFSLFQFQAALL